MADRPTFTNDALLMSYLQHLQKAAQSGEQGMMPRDFFIKYSSPEGYQQLPSDYLEVSDPRIGTMERIFQLLQSPRR